jgi:hypothetical protein
VKTSHVVEALELAGVKPATSNTVWSDSQGRTHHSEQAANLANLEHELTRLLTPINRSGGAPPISGPSNWRGDPRELASWVLEHAPDLRPFILAHTAIRPQRPEMRAIKEE